MGVCFAGTMDYEWESRRLPVLQSARRALRRARLLPKRKQRSGKLCLLSHSLRVQEVLGGLGRPNGMGFSPEGNTLYVTDSAKQQILKFPYQVETGSLRPTGHSRGDEQHSGCARWAGNRRNGMPMVRPARERRRDSLCAGWPRN